ncbi:SMI1/KNR4 family protein [Campylobacterota bacterium DY0563]
MNNELKINFENQALKCKFNKENIIELEKYFNTKFDDEYKSFLLNYGSVLFEVGLPDSFIAKYEDEEIIENILNFLSFQEMIDAYTLLREINEYDGESQIEEYMIPIAHMNDSYYRNYILINKKDNSIWCTKEVEDFDAEKVTGFVANNFTEFLESLDDEDNLEDILESK